MKITKIGIFAYATEGEALEVANNTIEDTGIAEVRIQFGDKPLCWIVLRESTINDITNLPPLPDLATKRRVIG